MDQNGCKIWSFLPVFSQFSPLFEIIVQKTIIFACFQPILIFFPPDLSMKYRIFISIVDISANLKNIDIDIDKEILKNIDIDKKILANIDINKISNRLEFGISNSATCTSFLDVKNALCVNYTTDDNDSCNDNYDGIKFWC